MKKKLTSLVKKHIPELTLLYLFGSMASGKSNKDSDYDLAFKSEKIISKTKVFQISNILADELGREVHLIDLRHASTVLKSQILETGKTLYSKDPIAQDYFEMYVLSDYARLNEERKDILADFYKD